MDKGAVGSARPSATRHRPGPIFRFFHHLFTERLTDAGKTVFWAGILAAGAGQATLVIHIYLVFCVIVGLGLTSIILARVARVRLEVRADLPARTSCGSRLALPLHVRSRSRRRAADVVLAEHRLPRHVKAHPPEGTPLGALEPGEAKVVTRELEFERRGHYELPGIVQKTLFPWGLWQDLVLHRQPRSLLVYPRFHPLTNLDIPVGKRYQPGGIALSSSLGDSIEFIGTREFREGDTLRAIHWRTWARLGKPAVKEFQEEYFCKVALLLDTFLPDRPSAAERADFEAAVSLAAAIADRLSREEYIVDLFAAGPEIYYLQAGRSLAYLENVLDILACLEPCHEPPFERIAPVLAENLATITTTIAIVLDWDERREEMVRTIRDYGSDVKLILVREGPAGASFASARELCPGAVQIGAKDEVESL